MSDEVLTMKEACDLAKCSEKPIKRAVAKGKLGGGKVGGADADAGGWRFTKRAILDWVDAGMPGSEADAEETKP